VTEANCDKKLLAEKITGGERRPKLKLESRGGKKGEGQTHERGKKLPGLEKPEKPSLKGLYCRNSTTTTWEKRGRGNKSAKEEERGVVGGRGSVFTGKRLLLHVAHQWKKQRRGKRSPRWQQRILEAKSSSRQRIRASLEGRREFEPGEKA